ncbi:MAG: BatD family protein, partial [Bacteroidota bacterium]
VSPWPSDAPTSFTGAVGKYTMTASSSHSNLTTDDAISLRMTISGNGDIKQVQAPPLVLSDSFEVYDPKVINESSFSERNGQLVSNKEFEYLVLPKYPGAYQLKPAFTYYDIDTAAYRTLLTQPFAINVRPGDPKRTQTNAAQQRASQEDIRYIKTETNLSRKGSSFLGSALFWIFLILPILGLGGALAYRQILHKRNNIDGGLLKKQRAKKVAEKRLTTAKIFLDQRDSRSFYDEISRAMLGYVCDKLNIPLAELTKANVQEKLQSLNVSPAPIDQFVQIIHTCETALYAGMDNADSMKSTYDSTISVVAAIEEEVSV